jgi:hypothetical protein
VEDTGTSDFTENTTGIMRKSLSEVGTCLAGEGAVGIEIVGTIEDPSDHVPLGQTNRVIADRIEHATIHFSVSLRMSRARGAVPE